MGLMFMQSGVERFPGHKVRTRSGSDRFVSEKLNDGGHNKSLPIGERTIAHAWRPGRYRSRF